MQDGTRAACQVIQRGRCDCVSFMETQQQAPVQLPCTTRLTQLMDPQTLKPHRHTSHTHHTYNTITPATSTSYNQITKKISTYTTPKTPPPLTTPRTQKSLASQKDRTLKFMICFIGLVSNILLHHVTS